MAFIPAEETLITEVSLDDFVVRNKNATFMMRVQTDEHNQIGILKGDILVVERNVEPLPRDLVILPSSEGWSLRHMNPSYISNGPMIVVRGVVRTL